MKPLVLRATLAAMPLASTACAFGEGEAFGVLEPSLEATWDARDERDAGGGWQRLATDFQVRLDRLALGIDAMEIEHATGASEGSAHCHEGECEEESAEHEPPEGVVSLPIGTIELLPPATRALACEPTCDLARGTLEHALATLTAIELTGSVRDGREPPRIDGEVPLVALLDLTPVAPTATAELGLVVDRDTPKHIVLSLRLSGSAELFDAIVFEQAVLESGALDLGSNANAAAAESLVAGLERLVLSATAKRHD